MKGVKYKTSVFEPAEIMYTMNMFDDDFDDNNIEDLLDSAPGEMRSGLPDLDIMIEGNKTIVKNYAIILRQMKRDHQHVSKFLSTELGVKTKKSDSQLVIYTKLRKEIIKSSFEKYVDRYIICQNCKKPDTVLQKSNKHYKFRCLACGFTTTLK